MTSTDFSVWSQHHRISTSRNHTSRFRVVAIVLGLVLLVSAGLKMDGLVLDPVSQGSALSSPQLEIASVEVEIIMGLWLLSAYSPRAAWLLALSYFAILAAASLYFILSGQRSCGCFGRVKTTPWLAFTIDITALFALFFSRPSPAPKSLDVAALRHLLVTVAGAAILSGVCFGILLLTFGDPSTVLAHVRGETLAVQPAVARIGEGKVGEQRDSAVQLTNWGDQPICIVGGSADCTCLNTESLPISIAPGESRHLRIRIAFKGDPGEFLHRLVLYTDCKEQPWVAVRVAGRVVSASTPARE